MSFMQFGYSTSQIANMGCYKTTNHNPTTTMKSLLVIACLLSYQLSSGQIHPVRNCKIEIYLLKKVLPGINTITKTNGRFLAMQKDLENTSFITNAEILTYSILKDSVKQADTAYISQTHVFEVLHSAQKN